MFTPFSSCLKRVFLFKTMLNLSFGNRLLFSCNKTHFHEKGFARPLILADFEPLKEIEGFNFGIRNSA